MRTNRKWLSGGMGLGFVIFCALALASVPGIFSFVNASVGYQVNGTAGSAGQALCSDATYFDTPCTFTQFYQTILNGTTAGSAVGQANYLAVGSGSGLLATTIAGVGSNVTRTAISINPTGSLTFDPEVTNSAGAGTSGNAMMWDANGGAGDSGLPAGKTSVAYDQYGSTTGCVFANDGGGLTCTPTPITWGTPFGDSSYTATCVINYTTSIAGGSSTQPSIILNWTPTSASAMALTEGASNGSSAGFIVASNYGATIYCHAHHN